MNDDNEDLDAWDPPAKPLKRGCGTKKKAEPKRTMKMTSSKNNPAPKHNDDDDEEAD